MTPALPQGVAVLERGWLSSNNIVFHGEGVNAVVDTGYVTHAAQTVALVEHVLGGRPLALVISTHLHSDHCGGNAALQARWPQARTLVPPGQAEAVRRWDPVALSHAPTGQRCAPFRLDGVLEPGRRIRLGDAEWEIHAAPGHDPHAVMLFEPISATLISADALWENGFGVVFPELEGEDAFDAVGASLDLVERLQPRVVIPGHGRPFGGDAVAPALARARSRLAAFVASPRRHASHGAKVLLKFKLLELQSAPLDGFLAWAGGTPHLETVRSLHFPELSMDTWLRGLVDELVQSGVAARSGDRLDNA